MNKTLTALFLTAALLLLSGQVLAQTHYFPEHTFGDEPKLDRFVSHWYSGQLKALKEPSLWEEAKRSSCESYRFLWLRTFHHPVAIRVDVLPDGSATLTTKVADGAGGYNPGKIITNTARPMTKHETERVLASFKDLTFWSLPAFERNKAGNDGSEWIVEAVLHGKYHLVSEWTPKSGSIYSLGNMFLFDLAGLTVPKQEMY